jgi:hypothetical protein
MYVPAVGIVPAARANRDAARLSIASLSAWLCMTGRSSGSLVAVAVLNAKAEFAARRLAQAPVPAIRVSGDARRMTTSTDLRARASAVMHDGDTDLEAFFGHFADDCRFAWGNEEPVQGLEAIQALVGRMLAGVTGLRHDVHEQLVGDDAVALRMDVTYTLPDGSEFHTPAVTYMRFSGDRIVEYLIYQDPAPLRAAASAA